MDSLSKIATCLGVPLSTFFDTDAPDMLDPVVHSFSLHRSMVSPQIIRSVLSHNTLDFDFLPHHYLLMPFSDPDTLAPEMYTHSKYILYPGDSIQIHSNQPHNWANNTNKVAEILSINYPNPFKSDQQDSVIH